MKYILNNSELVHIEQVITVEEVCDETVTMAPLFTSSNTIY